MANKLPGALVQTYNELLIELKKLVLRNVNEQQGVVAKKFKERADELKCPPVAYISTLQGKMARAVELLKSVKFEGKSITLGPPPVKA